MLSPTQFLIGGARPAELTRSKNHTLRDSERTATPMTKYEPDVLAKGLAVVFCGLNAATSAWILPNPSGLNRGFTIDALVGACSQLRIALIRPPAAFQSGRAAVT